MSSKEFGRLANLLGATATGLTDAVQATIRAQTGLDATAASALVSLLDFSPRGSVLALSQILGLTHSGAVRLVDRLVLAGLVTRTPGQDARSLTVALTAKGTGTAHRLRQSRSSVLESVLRGLSGAEQEALTALAEKLTTEVTRQRIEQRHSGRAPESGALCRWCDFAACGRPDGRCPAEQAARVTQDL